MEEGDIVDDGPFEVSNVVGSSKDSGSMADFWSEYTDKDFDQQKCGILYCSRYADVGGHMWIKGLTYRNFCFILPICYRHNNSTDLDFPNYKKTKKNVVLVARYTIEEMFD